MRVGRRAVDEQQLAAPRAAVGAEAHAVERDTQRRALAPVLGQHGADVRVVVLDGDRRHVPRRGEPRGEVRAVEVGVQVVRDGPRRHLQRGHQVLDREVERRAGRRVVEVADVLREEGLVAAGHAGRVLEPAAGGDDRRRGRARGAGVRGASRRGTDRRVPQPPRTRSARAGSPAACSRARGAGTAARPTTRCAPRCRRSGSTMSRSCTSSASAMPPSRASASSLSMTSGSPPGLALVITSTSGCGRGEPRGARRPAGGLVEEQVLQRRVRQHRAQPRETRRDARQRGIGAGGLRRQHDRPRGRLEQRALGGADVGQPGERRRVGDHHREGLGLARLARAQARHRVGVAGVAGEVKAAEALDRDDLAASEPRDGRGDRVDRVQRRAVGREQRQPRTAGGAGVRLGVKAAVVRRAVLGEARRALVERRHAGLRAVVRAGARVMV